MPDIRSFNPDGLVKPISPASHVTRAKASEFIFIAGQIAIDQTGKTIGVGDFDAQCVQVFTNIGVALQSCGAGWANIVQFNTFLVQPHDIAKFSAYRLREFPKLFRDIAYPSHTLLVIDALVKPEFLIEVQVTAAI